ncbi:hypothetical protein QYF61_025360, partial [Mycteria americana]
MLKGCFYQVHMFAGRAAVQRELVRLGKWVDRNVTKFIKDDWVGSPPQQDRLGTSSAWDGKQLCQKGAGVPGGQHGALAAKGAGSLLGCVTGRALRRWREVIVSLCSALVKLHLHTASSFGFTLEGAQQRTTKMVRQEHLPCEVRAVQPGEEMALGGPNSSPQHLRGGDREDRGKIHKSMSNNGDELQQGKFQL